MQYTADIQLIMIDLVIFTALFFMITLFIIKKELYIGILFKKQNFIDRTKDRIPFSIKNKADYEKKYLDTHKDLQNLKFALDEANLVQIVDKHANIMYANDQFCSLSGYTFDELKGNNMRMLNINYHSKEFFQELWATVSQGKVWKGEMRNKAKNGSYFWVNTTIVPFLDKDNKPVEYIVIRNNITQSKENEEKLEYLSNVDGLTSLYNRRYFDNMLDYYWNTLYQTKDYLSVIIFDVDYFKYYNDYYGHLMGDQCLIDISNRVKELLWEYEVVCARYGGEEFAILLPYKDLHESSMIAEMIRIAICQLQIPHKTSKRNDFVTMSFGVASIIPSSNIFPKELLKLADTALYSAKGNGRNRVVNYVEYIHN
ncbi:sensor domain-containing diguanylate cyclase [Robertmurraya sp. FSL R5-0851]|uniref:sensor domain-containing diguanylate cyclase n=1 Tax=Robertmurraya sp. FSL R5-0851 TaxID=2921584 RepID=UPI0030FCA74E